MSGLGKGFTSKNHFQALKNLRGEWISFFSLTLKVEPFIFIGEYRKMVTGMQLEAIGWIDRLCETYTSS